MMEELIEYIRSENDLLDRQIEERRERWNNFWNGFSSYVSAVRIYDQPILAPVMTAEKRREMQVYKKQACITEVKQKTRKREKEFLNRVERSLEEIQRETSEKEMSLRKRESLLESSQYFTPDNLESFEQTNNNAVDTDSSVPGEIIHIKPSPPEDGNGMRVRARRSHSDLLARKDSDSVHTSDSEDTKSLLVVTVPKIHRRRRESGESTGSDVSRPDTLNRQRSASYSEHQQHDMSSCEQQQLLQQAAKVPVRRTGSDGSYRLRRSGSERSLKRSGSDKALRRTGSGDIPTVIMSDSTPRMHRRVLSGDMSSLCSSKQSAVNKLTRSYDMSIRSLMSEELNVRPRTSHTTTDTSRDLGGNELLVDPMPASHTLLLSPKYAPKESASTAAVKLLSRPASQPLKKQASPNKESGPPQPLKGIHTLPPSLPASRESTFDSLSQRSPTWSDGGTELKEERTSRKSSIVIADSLDMAVESSSVRREVESAANASPGYKNVVSSQPYAVSNKLGTQSGGNGLQSALVSPFGSPQSHDLTEENIHSKVEQSPQSKEQRQPQVEVTEDSSARPHTAVAEDSSARPHTALAEDYSARPHTALAEDYSARPHTALEEDSSAKADITTDQLVESIELKEEEADTVRKLAPSDAWNVGHSSAVIDSPGFLTLPAKLRPASDLLPQQWLVDKISQLNCSGEVNLEDWLRNAPDSVKQKLNQLLPNMNKNEAAEIADRDVGVSIDDTLRSTTPLPDESGPITQQQQTPPTKPLFGRSNSYTLDKPSEALLSADRESRANMPRNPPPKFFPSPDKSESLPITHNRVESKCSHPSDNSTPSTRYQAHKEPKGHKTAQPVNSTQPLTSTQPIFIETVTRSSTTTDVSSHSPSAIERNKAMPSKSYVVSEPSAALLNSLNESQKSAVESALNSALNSAMVDQSIDEVSTVSECSTLQQSLQDSNGSGQKQGSVQRKLEYFSLANLSAIPGVQTPGAESQSSPLSTYHIAKYDSSDIPKRAHIQRYLQQLGLADKPVREAWGDTSPSLKSQSKYHKTPSISSADSDGGGSDSKATSRRSSNSSSGNSKSSQGKSVRRAESLSVSNKNSPVDQELFNKVRRELTLLKSKYSKKLSSGETTDQRPSSAQPKSISNQPKSKDHRPSTASAYMSTPNVKRQQSHQHQQQSTASSADTSLVELRERIHTTNKHSGGPSSAHSVKSFAEKEATPISTGYSSYVVPSIDDSSSEYSSFGGIHSVAHPRPPTATTLSSSPSQSYYLPHTHSTSRPVSQSKCRTITLCSPSTTTRLAAVIKGHLCRRLLATCKVQSIVKTIRDCRNLLPSRSNGRSTAGSNGLSHGLSHSQTLSLQQLNFQERLLDQWEAALLDIHEIFFELPVDKRIALIQQSDLEIKAQKQKQTKNKVVRKTSNKEQQPPKKRISSATQKFMDRKKVQKAAPETTAKKPVLSSGTTVFVKKAVLAPTYAANSPKKYTPATTSSRLTKAPVRHPEKISHESSISRQVSRV